MTLAGNFPSYEVEPANENADLQRSVRRLENRRRAFRLGMGQRRIHLLDCRLDWNRGSPPLLVVVLVFLILTGSALQFLKLPHLLFGLCRISLLAIQARE